MYTTILKREGGGRKEELFLLKWRRKSNMRKGGFGWGREGEPDWEVRLSQSSAETEKEEDDKKGRKMEWAGDSNSNSVNDKKIPMRYFRPFFPVPLSVEFNLILIGGDDRVGRTTGEKAALRRQTRFNSNGVMGIRSAMPQRRQFIILINAKGAEEREREGAGFIQRRPSRIFEIRRECKWSG